MSPNMSYILKTLMLVGLITEWDRVNQYEGDSSKQLSNLLFDKLI